MLLFQTHIKNQNRPSVERAHFINLSRAHKMIRTTPVQIDQMGEILKKYIFCRYTFFKIYYILIFYI